MTYRRRYCGEDKMKIFFNYFIKFKKNRKKYTTFIFMLFTSLFCYSLFLNTSIASPSIKGRDLNLAEIDFSQLCELSGYTLFDCSEVKQSYDYKMPELGEETLLRLENGMVFRTTDPLAFMISRKKVAIFETKYNGTLIFRFLVEDNSRILTGTRIR
jgi:hypothetical protein